MCPYLVSDWLIFLNVTTTTNQIMPPMRPLHAPYAPLHAPMCPLHAPYVPPCTPTRPLCAPTHPLCAPMRPLRTPTHPLHAPTCPLCAPTRPLHTPMCLLPVMGIKCYGYLEFFLYIVFIIQECYWLMNSSNQVPPMLPYAPLSCF